MFYINKITIKLIGDIMLQTLLPFLFTLAMILLIPLGMLAEELFVTRKSWW